MTLAKLKLWAKEMKAEMVALSLAIKDARTPRVAKLLAMGVLAYALSPIDLIPDFIPVIGYLDDLIILPLGLMLAVKLIPVELMEEFRAKAVQSTTLPMSKMGAAIVFILWLVGAIALAIWMLP